MPCSPRSCLLLPPRSGSVTLALVPASSLSAAETIPAGWWTLRGPSDDLAGRPVAGIVAGANDDGAFFSATEAGLWRGGAEGWQRGARSLAFSPPLVVSSPTRPDVVVAVTNLVGPTLHPRALTSPPVETGFVEVSRDGGATFERCIAAPPLPASSGRWRGENRTIADLAFDPDAPTEVFLASSDGLLWRGRSLFRDRAA
jgi:hypothetical protein